MSKNRLYIPNLVWSAKKDYTFHPQRISPYIFLKMWNPFNIGLKFPSLHEALWNRMLQGGTWSCCYHLPQLCVIHATFRIFLPSQLNSSNIYLCRVIATLISNENLCECFWIGSWNGKCCIIYFDAACMWENQELYTLVDYIYWRLQEPFYIL